MTVRHLICVATVLGMTQGCVVYDRAYQDCRDGDCGEAWDDATSCPPDGNTDPEPEPSYELLLEPSAAEAGETLIAYLTVDGDLELSEIAKVVFVGDVDVLAVDARDDELVLTLDVWEHAQLGLVDVLVTLGDGSGLVMPEAFEILEATTMTDTGDDDCPESDTGI